MRSSPAGYGVISRGIWGHLPWDMGSSPAGYGVISRGIWGHLPWDMGSSPVGHGVISPPGRCPHLPREMTPSPGGEMTPHPGGISNPRGRPPPRDIPPGYPVSISHKILATVYLAGNCLLLSRWVNLSSRRSCLYPSHTQCLTSFRRQQCQVLSQGPPVRCGWFASRLAVIYFFFASTGVFFFPA